MTSIEISREEFESTLAMAINATCDVYDKMGDALAYQGGVCANDFLGAAGLAAIEGGNAPLEAAAKRFICVRAMRLHLRELDLVLTPTGFGVVSNETTAPASKERVDKLEAELMARDISLRSELLDVLTGVFGWGDTQQAGWQINNLCWDTGLLGSEFGLDLTTLEGYRDYMHVATRTHLRLCRAVGREQMDKLVSMERNGRREAPYGEAMRMVRELTFCTYMHTFNDKQLVREFVDFLENNPDKFAAYMESDAYKRNHLERFKNRGDSPAYTFVG